MSFRLIGSTLNRFEHAVVSLHADGFYGSQLRALGVPVSALGMSRGQVSSGGWRRLRRLIKDFEPDVVQTRLYHADLLGGLATHLACDAPVVWGVHATELGRLRDTWKTCIVRRLCAWTSSTLAAAVVSDAHVTALFHEKLGYKRELLHVIPNGVDASVFQPDAQTRQRQRSAWGVAADEIAVGCVARWDPLKDHENLLRAVGVLAGRGLRFRCILVGTGMTTQNKQLAELVERCGAHDHVVFAGPTSDVPAAMNACDLHVLSSRAESLPVAVIEAMACATPCVVTDVGDSAELVGDTGWVVPAQDHAALALAIETAMNEYREDGLRARGVRCRERIVQGFTLEQMANKYADLWASLSPATTKP